jgi:creatinine amidohydrolase/Fe(II)-dependent formamide hydrolase-like protein
MLTARNLGSEYAETDGAAGGVMNGVACSGHGGETAPLRLAARDLRWSSGATVAELGSSRGLDGRGNLSQRFRRSALIEQPTMLLHITPYNLHLFLQLNVRLPDTRTHVQPCQQIQCHILGSDRLWHFSTYSMTIK